MAALLTKRSVVFPSVVLLVLSWVGLSSQIPVQTEPENSTEVPPDPLKGADYIKICKRHDPDMEQCILNSATSMMPYLIKGIPEIGVPALDPLRIPHIKVVVGGQSAVKATGHDIDVHGLTNYVIKKFTVDLETLTFDASVEMPELYFEGNFAVDGRVMNFPIHGSGPIKSNATDIVGDILLKGKLVKRDRGDFLHFTSVEVDLDIKKFHVDIVFNGDEVLTEAANAMINEDPHEFLQSMLPIVEKTTEDVILDLANKIIQNFTYDEIFPLD